MAKRTYEQSLKFFKHRKTHLRGEGRELYKTPIFLIDKIIYFLITYKPELKNYYWIDPCAGDGRWQKIWEQYNIKGKSFDIEPLSDIVIKKDFYDLKTSDIPTEKSLFFIGNPPFKQVKNFVEKSLSLCDMSYFLGGSGILTGKLSNKVELLHRFEGWEGNQKDKRSKMLFEDSNNRQVLVWCCGALFTNSYHPKFIKYKEIKENTFSAGIGNFILNDNRIITFKK